jgi:hypothetical protein
VYVFRAYKVLEQVDQDRSNHLNDLTDISLAMTRLFTLLDLLLEDVFGDVSNHQLDAQVAIVLAYIHLVAWKHPLKVTPYHVRVCNETEPIIVSTYERHHSSGVWKPATGNVTCRTWHTSVVAHVLVIVRVVDDVRLDTPRAPTERRVTLGTPHLVTPINFEN